MNTSRIRKTSLASSTTIMLALVLLLSTVGSAMAEDTRVAPDRNVPTVPSQALGPTDPAELEAFLDDLLRKEMEEHHIAGAAVSVVKDGKLFLPKATATPTLRKTSPLTPRRRSLVLVQSASYSPGLR